MNASEHVAAFDGNKENNYAPHNRIVSGASKLKSEQPYRDKLPAVLRETDEEEQEDSIESDRD